MCLVLELVMLIVGITTLVKGTFGVGSRHAAKGVPARIAGAILMLPLPLKFLCGMAIGLALAVQEKQVDRNDPVLAYLETGITLGCLVTALVLAGATAKPVGTRDEKEEEMDFDEDDVPPLQRDSYARDEKEGPRQPRPVDERIEEQRAPRPSRPMDEGFEE
jgi:hypothetical protein